MFVCEKCNERFELKIIIIWHLIKVFILLFNEKKKKSAEFNYIKHNDILNRNFKQAQRSGKGFAYNSYENKSLSKYWVILLLLHYVSFYHLLSIVVFSKLDSYVNI